MEKMFTWPSVLLAEAASSERYYRAGEDRS